MKCAVLVALLVAVAAVQGANVHDSRTLISEAKKGIEELKAAIKDAIDGAKGDLDGLLDGARSLAESTIASGKLQMNAEIDNVLNEIAALRLEAADLGQDIEGCIGEQEEALKQLPITLATELLECVTDQLNEAITIIKDTVTAVEETWNAISNIEEDLTDCDGKVLCLLDVIADVTGKVISLPIKIAKQVIKAKDFVESIKTDLEVCAVVKVAQVAVDAGVILADIVKCVDAQLIH